MKILDLDMTNPEEAKAQISAALEEYKEKPVRVYIGRHFQKFSKEDKEAKAQAKAERKAARKEAASQKAVAKLEKAEKRAKKAQEVLEKLQAKAAPKKVKKSHHKSG